MKPELREKYERLRKILSSFPSAIAAFSAGVDSALLAVVAADVLGDRFSALTILSVFNPPELRAAAEAFAARFGFRHEWIRVEIEEDPEILRNPPDRCYRCKKLMMERIWAIARERGAAVVIEGQNADDGKVYRPGRRAVEETGTRSPLAEAGLTKAEIRALSKELGLPTWNAPASPCLATRIPYNVPIRRADLDRIAEAERRIKELGIADCRVRLIAGIAVIEVAPEDMETVLSAREALNTRLRALGFERCVLDLGGYRSGSFDGGLMTRPGAQGGSSA